MFAVIRSGGKQYRVATDDVIAVERLAGEPGTTIELGEVLMIADGNNVSAGTPLLAGARVSADIVAQRRRPKIIVFKKERRKNYRRKKGHRQYETVLKIGAILAAGEPAREAGRPRAARAPREAAEPRAETEPQVQAEQHIAAAARDFVEAHPQLSRFTKDHVEAAAAAAEERLKGAGLTGEEASVSRDAMRKELQNARRQQRQSSEEGSEDGA
jgi:large subunit ribosomal protein L21